MSARRGQHRHPQNGHQLWHPSCDRDTATGYDPGAARSRRIRRRGRRRQPDRMR